jgi:hypothetical protein
MAQCHAVIAPISVPVGNRSRILTAMAKGAVVVAHENAAMGNPDLIDGETCYLARSPAEFIERMKRSFLDERASQQIIDRARACYNTRFHPDIAAASLIARVKTPSGVTRPV